MVDDFTEMMDFQNLVIIDALLENWGQITLMIRADDPSALVEFQELGEKLGSIKDEFELAILLDDILELTEETAAGAFVKDLLARSDAEEFTVAKNRSGESLAPTDRQGEGIASRAVASLGVAMVGKPEPFRVPIYYVTNRNKDSKGGHFGGELVRGLTFGSGVVTLPIDHRLGKLESPSWWTRHLGDAENPNRFVVFHNQLETAGPAEFCSMLSESAVTAGRSDILVFTHGYNVTFEEAARRAAQLAFDLRFDGVVVLFSWPSQGKFSGYIKDETMAEASSERYAEFLRLLEGGPWGKVHLVAHSMGNRVLLSGLADNPRNATPLGRIIFAAADVFHATFESKYPKMAECGDVVTSYVSRDDRPLFFSKKFHSGPRVGLPEKTPFVFPNVETIDASAVRSGILGLEHSYFGDDRMMLTDLRTLVDTGARAADPRRSGLVASPTKDHWLFPR